MRVVEAVSMGLESQRSLPREGHLCGSVIGAYSKGLYYQLGERVYLIHDRRDGGLPFGIELDGFASAVVPCGRRAGDMVLVFPEEIRLEKNPLTIIVRSKEHQPCGRKLLLTPGGLRKRADDMQGFLDVSRAGWLNVLRSEGHKPGKESVRVLSRIEREKARLLHGLSADDEEKVQFALRGLIGMGIGLTPSMDDWLVGFVYALRRMPVSRREADLLSRSILHTCREGRTGQISMTYLQSAAEGEYFELLDLCLCEGSRRSMEDLSKTGSSSGGDMLEGMCAALKYVIDSSPL